MFATKEQGGRGGGHLITHAAEKVPDKDDEHPPGHVGPHVQALERPRLAVLVQHNVVLNHLLDLGRRQLVVGLQLAVKVLRPRLVDLERRRLGAPVGRHPVRAGSVSGLIGVVAVGSSSSAGAVAVTAVAVAVADAVPVGVGVGVGVAGVLLVEDARKRVRRGADVHLRVRHLGQLVGR